MQLAISQVCSLDSPFEQDIEHYAAGGCPAVEIWLGKLETYLESHSVGDVRSLLDTHQMAAPVASYQGGLFAGQEDARRVHWDHFQQRLKLCQTLDIGVLVVAADVAERIDEPAFRRIRESLGEGAALAASHDVRLALEFQARAGFVNNLQTAAALVAEIGNEHLGICLDVFHYYCGPSKTEDLAALTRDNLFHVQLCDLAGQTRELASDSDRILPGDGQIPLEPILARLRQIDYARAVSVELMNPQLWRVAPRQFGEIAVTSLKTVLGVAESATSPVSQSPHA